MRQVSWFSLTWVSLLALVCLILLRGEMQPSTFDVGIATSITAGLIGVLAGTIASLRVAPRGSLWLRLTGFSIIVLAGLILLQGELPPSVLEAGATGAISGTFVGLIGFSVSWITSRVLMWKQSGGMEKARPVVSAMSSHVGTLLSRLPKLRRDPIKRYEALSKLRELKDAGVVTEEEFEREKRALLD